MVAPWGPSEEGSSHNAGWMGPTPQALVCRLSGSHLNSQMACLPYTPISQTVWGMTRLSGTLNSSPGCQHQNVFGDGALKEAMQELWGHMGAWIPQDCPRKSGSQAPDMAAPAVPMLTFRISCVTWTSMLRLLRFSRARLLFWVPEP